MKNHVDSDRIREITNEILLKSIEVNENDTPEEAAVRSDTLRWLKRLPDGAIADCPE